MCSPTGGGSAPSTFSSSAGPAVVQEGPPFFFWSPEDEEGPGVTLAMGGACKSGSHNLCCSFELKERDNAVTEALWKSGVECKMFHSYCLRDPYSVRTEGVGIRGQTSLENDEYMLWQLKEQASLWFLSFYLGIGSVSHFMSCCWQNPGPALGAPLNPPTTLPVPAHWPRAVSLETLGLAHMPKRKDGTTVGTKHLYSASGCKLRHSIQLKMDSLLQRCESNCVT